MAEEQQVGEHPTAVMPAVAQFEAAQQARQVWFADHQQEAADEQAGACPAADDGGGAP